MHLYIILEQNHKNTGYFVVVLDTGANFRKTCHCTMLCEKEKSIHIIMSVSLNSPLRLTLLETFRCL